MIKIYIFADSYRIYDKAILEYEKRLWKDIKIEKLKPFKNNNSELVIEKETDFLKKILEKDKSYKIILSPVWKKFTTEKFYDFIENKKQNYWNISFFIWWANWLNYKKLKNYSDLELSLSDFTLPHSLALTLLVEQIYRLSMIKKWTHYNK